ncbi:MAG: hypothetical protein M3P95_01825, partial [Actinomycetota bacterium]|nr:hypothetical protein [Actinomycetota bacterium]
MTRALKSRAGRAESAEVTRLCPSCAGVVGATAEWCGLCFVDLRAGARPPSYAGSAAPPAGPA